MLKNTSHIPQVNRRRVFTSCMDNRLYICINEDNSFVCITCVFNQRFMIKKLHIDFEKTAHQATYQVFENVQFITCRFLLGQF